MAGYVKVWTDIENDEVYVTLDCIQRGIFLQMLIAAKKDGDTGHIRAKNWTYLGARWACDPRTCSKIAAKLQQVCLIEIQTAENLIDIFICNYDYWQGLTVKEHFQKTANLRQISRLPDQTRPDQTNKEQTASPPSLPTKACVDLVEFDLLVRSAVRLGFGDNGHKCINRMFRDWPELRREPQRLAWYLNRIHARRYDSQYGSIQNAWAYLKNMIDKNAAVPAVCQGGDDNYYRQEKTVADYCNPILGITPTVVRDRVGGLDKLGDVMPKEKE